MTLSADTVTSIPVESGFSGAARLFIGFAAGALFALLPMYYVYVTRDTVARDVARPAVGTGKSLSLADSGIPTPRFAARMTYELSQLPQELPPPPKAASAAPPVPKPSAASPPERVASVASEVGAVPANRVVKAKPIASSPPDPRDTPREMSKARPDTPARSTPPVPVAAVQPRVVEGRDIVIPPMNDNKIAQSKAPAPGPSVSGVTPIGPPAEAPNRPTAARPVPVVPVGTAAAPASIAKATSTAKPVRAAGVGDIVQSRLAATREWLAASPQTAHTIQILGSSSDTQLKIQLKSLSKLLEPGNIYVFRTVAHGKSSTTVVYGAYPDRQAALQALAKLPPAVAANKPVLRTVSGIRAELKQHKTDS